MSAGRTAESWRELVVGCATPQTYKYWLPRDQVSQIWTQLIRDYGPLHRNKAFGTQELHTPQLIIRATRMGNPLTVFRARRCTQADLDHFHALVNFDEQRAAA